MISVYSLPTLKFEKTTTTTTWRRESQAQPIHLWTGWGMRYEVRNGTPYMPVNHRRLCEGVKLVGMYLGYYGVVELEWNKCAQEMTNISAACVVGTWNIYWGSLIIMWTAIQKL